MYALIRPLLFTLDPETSHALTLRILAAISRRPAFAGILAQEVPQLPVELMGLRFANPVGLAAGFDKDACAVSALAGLGFGALELGTVTPLPQMGNPRPRIFRVPSQSAIINRLGFNSAGLKQFLQNLSRHRAETILGINIGKNTETPVDHAAEDYCACMDAVYSAADYVTINISSPNTEALRKLQTRGHLDELLGRLKAEQTRLSAEHGRYVPLAVKIAPDLDASEVAEIAASLLRHRFDGVIATNTTVRRPGLQDKHQAQRNGGLSGPPLHSLSTKIIKCLYEILQGRIPIIGVGGVNSTETAWQKLEAGAEMVQLYTSMVYDGPGIIRRIVLGLAERTRSLHSTTLSDALAQARPQSCKKV